MVGIRTTAEPPLSVQVGQPVSGVYLPHGPGFLISNETHFDIISSGGDRSQFKIAIRAPVSSHSTVSSEPNSAYSSDFPFANQKVCADILQASSFCDFRYEEISEYSVNYGN